MINKICFSSPIGYLTVWEENNFITAIEFNESKNINVTPLLLEARKQLEAYFDKKLREFNLPIKICGTAFQQSVYNELLKIPYGDTASYKDIAYRIGSPKAMRAVGNANNKNKIPIIIPCHRVIGSNGNLIGYAGGLNIKEYLLKLENSKANQNHR